MRLFLVKGGLEALIIGEGFYYGDFNKAGKMDIWRLAKHNEFGSEFHIGRSPLRLLLRGNSSSQRSFIRFQSMEMSPEFYELASPSSPWQTTVRMSSIGTTSRWYEYVTSCQRTGAQLVRCLMQAVRVDPATRRPVPHPKEGLEMYRKAATASPPPRFVFPNARPAADRVFTESLKAVASETDINNHVNQAAVLRYCIDCASSAAMQGGVLERFTKDMAYYNLKQFSVEYVGEINAGDEVQVLCWEDTSRAGVLCFLIENQQKTACRGVGEWYMNSDGSLVEYDKNIIDMLEYTMKSKL